MVVIIQRVRQNIAHALHAKLFNDGLRSIICKVHSVEVVCNRFFNGVSALFIELSGNAVQIHFAILCCIAERFVIDRNVRIIRAAFLHHRNSLFFFLGCRILFSKILLYGILEILIKAIPQIFCHKFSLLIDRNAGSFIPVFLMLQQEELLATDLRFINRIPCTNMTLNCNLVGVTVY